MARKAFATATWLCILLLCMYICWPNVSVSAQILPLDNKSEKTNTSSQDPTVGNSLMTTASEEENSPSPTTPMPVRSNKEPTQSTLPITSSSTSLVEPAPSPPLPDSKISKSPTSEGNVVERPDPPSNKMTADSQIIPEIEKPPQATSDTKSPVKTTNVPPEVPILKPSKIATPEAPKQTTSIANVTPPPPTPEKSDSDTSSKTDTKDNREATKNDTKSNQESRSLIQRLGIKNWLVPGIIAAVVFAVAVFVLVGIRSKRTKYEEDYRHESMDPTAINYMNQQAPALAPKRTTSRAQRNTVNTSRINSGLHQMTPTSPAQLSRQSAYSTNAYAPANYQVMYNRDSASSSEDPQGKYASAPYRSDARASRRSRQEIEAAEVTL